MKKLFALAAIMVCCVLNLNAQQTGPFNQFFYEECEWFANPTPVECSQDWYLFAYWPLTCTEVCEDAICLGLFPSSTEDQTFDIPDDTYCCEFILSGQLNWLVDVSGTTTYADAGFAVTFNWKHSDLFGGPYTSIFVGAGSPGFLETDDLNDPIGGGMGAHYYQICAEDVFLAGGFNGEGNVTTTLTAVYSM